MKIKHILLTIVIFLFVDASAEMVRYSGGDISMYPTYQKAGSQYKDQNGNNIDLLPYLHEIGMNAMRVRLFVNPDGYTYNNKGQKEDDSNVCQDLPYIIPLCKDIISNGFDLMLDFHYSDTWADPGKQYIPDAWKGLSDEVLADSIYNYTKNSLVTLKENGITPKFIQPGNEISYGMLWADSSDKAYYGQNNSKAWKRFGDFLDAAIRACREVCEEAQIVIHTERIAQVDVLKNFYSQMKSLNIDYDIIGLSYYPYFHGTMAKLDNALTVVEREFPDKPIMIVETGFPYEYEVQGTTEKVEYEYTLAGQDAYAHALVDTLLSHPNVNGLFWWWLEYNAYGAGLTGWYNAPLFNSKDGKATPALKTIASFSSGAGIEEIMDEGRIADPYWYDLQGRRHKTPDSPGIYFHNGEKFIVK
ncbi:MAG: glycosyl hydrolase 53 family protein [Muribaculaceae bacterium]|nr:glycosyl hydrolase 53 family protein [Muribaculaceae bacterium]